MSTERFNVVIQGGLVIAVSRAPLTHGVSIGCRAYQVEATSREEAKIAARARFSAGDPSDSACWGGRER